MKSESLTITNLVKSYGKTNVLSEVSLSAKTGEFIVLVGPSGCGKSTLLRSIAGLEQINGGSIEIGAKDISTKLPKDRDISMVFQDYALYPHKTVYENIAFSLRLKKLGQTEIDQKVREAAGLLDLTNLLSRKPSELSGGQRQRVAIGRAIVREPKVFLFDEPLSNLDAKLRGEMRVLIGKLHKSLRATVVYVTHDQVEAMTLADKIVVLNKGKIQQSGAPLDLYYHPVNTFVAQFLGSPTMNLTTGSIIKKNDGYHFCSELEGLDIKIPEKFHTRVQTHTTENQKVLWGTRPDNFKVSTDYFEGAIKVKVVVTEPLGPTTYLHCEAGKNELQVAAMEPLRPSAGDEVYIGFESTHFYLFDEKTGLAIDGY